MVEYNDIIVNLSDCGDGFVRRRWSIVGRSDIFCDQTITIDPIESTPVTVSFSQVGYFTVEGCPDDIAIGEPTWTGSPCDLIAYSLETDTFLFEDGACYKLVNNWTVINWCTYEPNNPDTEGVWEHTQVVKVTDNTQPEIVDCADKMYEVNDHSDADNDGNTCEATITLTNSATDLGSENCPTGWLKWQIVIDLWGDGTDDLEYNSFLPPFDSNFNDTNGNGIPDVYVSPTANGDTISITLPEIDGSMSNHKVTWTVSDGCNNVRSCSNEFMVVDKKAPTPYCVDISTAVMDNDGTVDIWAVDFNIGSFDNCTAQEELRYTFTNVAPENDNNYDPEQRSSSRTFDCDDMANSPVEIEMYVWDEKGNSDFCVVFLTLVDNNSACGDGMRISGTIATETGAGVHEVQTTLMADLPEYPKLITTDEGMYSFTNIPMNVEYEIIADKTGDWLNGVSTLDLVKIQRHILGLQLLDSPYKVIAADINGDESLKASDLSQLRKLILGVTLGLADNTSWRFVDSKQVFTDITNPWPIDESIETGILTDSLENQNFVAIKIGDVSGNAIPGLTGLNISEVRGDNPYELNIDDRRVEEGDEVVVTMTSDMEADVFGYQFTLELNGLAYEKVEGGLVPMTETNIGQLSDDVLTISYSDITAIKSGDDSEMFTMVFEARESGMISDMISLTSKITPSEAYLGEQLEVRKVVLTNNRGIAEAGENALYQNEPNPFKDRTTIKFKLLESGSVTMKVTDVTGKLLKVIETEGVRGMNYMTLESEDFGISGVLYYTIESGEFTDTKKMIIVR